jgi:hypothetical protein
MMIMSPEIDQAQIDHVEQMLAGLGAGPRGLEHLNKVLGQAAYHVVRDHLRDRNLTVPTPLGAPKSNYYERAADSTTFVVDPGGATVSISGIAAPGIALHYFGGTVKPGQNPSSFTGQPTKYLTIPISPEAYGHSASEFDDLVVLWGRNGPWALARKALTPKQRRLIKSRGYAGESLTGDNAGELMYLLVKEATIQPNPEVLPDEDDIAVACQDAMSDYLEDLALVGGNRNPNRYEY